MRHRLLSLVLTIALWPLQAAAAPITYQYTGSITSTFNESLVPLNSPVTMRLTFDPDKNTLAHVPNLPADAAEYAFTIAMSFTDRTYLLLGYQDVNYDARFSFPLPGQALWLYSQVGGPALVPGLPNPFTDGYPPATIPCAFGACGPNSPSNGVNSNAFWVPPGFTYDLIFVGPETPKPSVRISVSDAQLVPEAPSLMLLGIGIIAMTARYRSRL